MHNISKRFDEEEVNGKDENFKVPEAFLVGLCFMKEID